MFAFILCPCVDTSSSSSPKQLPCFPHPPTEKPHCKKSSNGCSHCNVLWVLTHFRVTRSKLWHGIDSVTRHHDMYEFTSGIAFASWWHQSQRQTYGFMATAASTLKKSAMMTSLTLMCMGLSKPRFRQKTSGGTS